MTANVYLRMKALVQRRNNAPELFMKVGLNMDNPLQKTPIAEAFRGRTLLITGVTGFLGKVLLEKILRSCVEIKEILVTMRSTDEESHHKRLRSLFKEPIFSRLRNENAAQIKKVRPVRGDVSLPACGLSEKDLNEILAKVSVVMHCAANVRFDETLRRAVAVNVEGVRNIVDLCHNLESCAALVHVSTAYAFCNVSEIIEERCNTEVVSPDELLTVCKWMGDEELELLFSTIKDGRPSVYHFTKAIAEHALYQERGRLPIFIVRPSIITAAWREPFPGWVDTNNGPSGLIGACGRGIVRSVHALPDIVADFIPVDVVANTIILAARSLINSSVESGPPFYVVNCTSNKANPVTWGEIQNFCLPLLFQYPSMTLYRYPGGSFKKCSFWHKYSMIWDHMIPAYLIEYLSYLTLNPFRTIKVYNKVSNVLSHLEYFTTNHFNFRSDVFLAFMNMDKTAPPDAEVFSVDIRALNWEEYFKNYVLGVRRYLLKENDETIPAAIKRMNRIYYTVQALKFTTLSICAWMLYQQNPLISRLLSKSLTVLVKTAERVPFRKHI